MTPKSLALWYMRNQRVQESRVVHCEQMGDIGGRDLAQAAAEIYANTVSALGWVELTPEDWREYENSCGELQQEFRDGLIEHLGGMPVAYCRLNGCEYDSLSRLIAYSRAKAVTNPGVHHITVEWSGESWSPSENFMQRRHKILCMA